MSKRPRGRPRKDVMKVQEIDHSVKPKPEGGMGHNFKEHTDAWDGKKPPYPRSALLNKTRSGMAMMKKG